MKPFFFLCLVAAALSWPFIYFPGHFSYDEGVYLATLSVFRSGAKLYEDIYYTQLPLFIRWLDWFSPSSGISVSGARWVIWSHFPLLLGSIGWVAFRLFGPVAAALAMFAATFDPPVAGMSHVVNGNIPAMAWAVAAWALALEARKREKYSWMVLSALALAIGVQFKPIALPALLPIVVSLADLRRIPDSVKSLAVFSVCFAFASALLLYLTGYELSYMSQLQGGAVAVQATAQPLSERLLRLWNYSAVVPIGFLGDDDNYSYWPLLLSASLALAFGLARRRSRAWALVACWWGAAVFGLLVHRQVWQHHVILLSPAISLAIGAFGAMALGEPKGRLRSLMVFVLAFTFLYSFRATLGPLREIQVARMDWEKNAAPIIKEIVDHTSADGYVVLDQPYFAVVSGRKIYPELVDPSRVRIRTGSLSCEKMDEMLRDPRTQMVVVERRFHALVCGQPFEEKVRALFPVQKKFEFEISTFRRN